MKARAMSRKDPWGTGNPEELVVGIWNVKIEGALMYEIAV
jgi:hypothetical protein